jgi:hypothetical protein
VNERGRERERERVKEKEKEKKIEVIDISKFELNDIFRNDLKKGN